MDFSQGHKVRGLVRAQVVVVVLSQAAVLAHLLQGSEEIAVEQFAARRTLEALDIDILRRADRLNPMQRDALALAPGLF